MHIFKCVHFLDIFTRCPYETSNTASSVRTPMFSGKNLWNPEVSNGWEEFLASGNLVLAALSIDLAPCSVSCRPGYLYSFFLYRCSAHFRARVCFFCLYGQRCLTVNYNDGYDNGRITVVAAYPGRVTSARSAYCSSTTGSWASQYSDVWNFIDAMGGQENLCRLHTVTKT